MTWGWWTPLRWSGGGPGNPRAAPSSQAGPSMGTAPATPATSGGSGCTCCARCTGCPPALRSLVPRPTNVMCCSAFLAADPDLAARLPGQIIIGDKNYFGREFEGQLAGARTSLLRPARQAEPERAGAQFFKPLRQVIESINDTLKGQLNLEHHGGHTPEGVIVRVLRRILALTAALWHNDHTGQPIMRSLVAYDH